jgi:serine/threonine protein kinase
MGEVHKARDTRLDRTVAIKILPDGLAGDPQFRERFDREARAISQLTHPHICTLYDVGDQHGTAFLVMEYLEGVTLADRLAKGALPLDQALKTGIEIASALDKAHRAGIVHRDLKPGNVMMTRQGAKLLDFGLAKNSAPAVAEAGRSMMPTTPANLTTQGTILGTYQYMAPEQLEGEEADARSDLFGFGAMLFEMLTGRKAFEGKSSTSLIGAILKDEPPLVSTLGPTSPPALDRLVRKCLEKDPEARWHSAHDLHDELAWIASERSAIASVAAGSVQTAQPRPSPWRERAGWIAALSVAVLGSALWMVNARGPGTPIAADAPEMRLQIVTPPSASLTGFAISPDRRTVVYQLRGGTQPLWIRSLDSDTARPLDGTVSGANSTPFWSPDGRSIGFFTTNELKRIDIDGGLIRTLAEAPQARGGTWSTTGTILFAAGSAGSLNAVPAAGGKSVVVTRVEAPFQVGHRFPHFLPDGRHFLFYCLGVPDSRGVYLGTLGSSEVRRLFDAESAAVFAAPDRVLFAREGALWAQRLNLPDLTPVGEPVPVATQVALNAELFGDVALSETALDLIAYLTSAGKRQFAWFDRTGRQIGAVGDPDEGQPNALVLSSDGRTATFRRTVNGNTDLWSIDVGRNLLRRLTVDPARDYDAVLSPAADRVVFASDRKGVLDFFEMPLSAGSASVATHVLETTEHKNTTDWSADGRYILYTVQSPKTGNDIWVLPLFGDRKPTPITQMAANEIRGHFSPDGRWVTYESNESGRSEIYVQSFPDLARKSQISTDGGTSAMWRSDGRELFYRSLDDRLMAVRITSSGTQIDTDRPSALFALPTPTVETNSARYAPSRDGQRFLVNAFVEAASPITVLLNWKPRD